MGPRLAATLTLLGLAAITYGAHLAWPPLAPITAGVGFITMAALTYDPDRTRG